MYYQYPLNLRFKLIALAPQIYVTDASGQNVVFVRQKIFKLKEDVRIFSDSSKSQELFRIRADRIIDFSAKYHFFDSQTDAPLGAIKHKGMRSIWSAHWQVFDTQDQQTHHMTEDNPWAKILDMMLGEIPVVGMFTGYVFHPSYTIYDSQTEEPIMRLTKQPAFFESRFTIDRLGGNLKPEEEQRLLLGILMAVQLERSRG